MPKVKYLDGKKDNTRKLMTLIAGEMSVQKYVASDVARFADVSCSTIYKRFQHPDKFTIGELTKICYRLGIPVDEFRSALMY